MTSRRFGLVAALIGALLLLPTTAFAAEKTAPEQEMGVHKLNTSAYPSVSFSVSLPDQGSDSADPKFALSENGKPVTASVSRLKIAGARTSVVLMLDTSGSMYGGPWDNVKRATSTFLTELDPATPVTVVSFNDRIRFHLRSSTNRELASQQTETMMPGRETALYDAIVAATRSLKQGPSGQNNAIVILSDGYDTVSKSTLKGAMKSLESADIPLYAVFLKSPEQNPEVLRQLANVSGGRLLRASQSDELPTLFQAVAKEIVGTYEIRYTSQKPESKDVELDVEARSVGRSAKAEIAYPNPKYLVRGGTEFEAPTVMENIVELLGFGVAALLATALLAFAILTAAVGDRTMLSQIGIYDQRKRRSRWRGSMESITGVAGKLVRRVDRYLEDKGYSDRIAPLLSDAGLQELPAYYVTSYLSVAVAIIVFVQLLTDAVPLTVLAVIIAAVLPKPILSVLAERRRAEFESQIVEVLSMLSSSLRGGWTLERALELVSTEGPQPAAREFGRVVTEVDLGMPVRDALDAMSKRLKSPELEALVLGVTVQRDVGGSIADVIDAVTDSVRERDQLRRQMRTLTAEARLSAYILIALPFMLFGMMYLTSRSYVNLLFESVVGIAILAITIVMVAVGSLWIFRLTKIEV